MAADASTTLLKAPLAAYGTAADPEGSLDPLEARESLERKKAQQADIISYGLLGFIILFVSFVTPTCVKYDDVYRNTVPGTPGYGTEVSWTWTAAFYYSIQAALGIGFGDLNVQTDVMMALMILECIGGSLFVAILISMVLSRIIAKLERDNEEVHFLHEKLVRPNLDYSGLLAALVLLLAVMIAGLIYGLVNEKWNFVTSLLFIVSACQTSGLVEPNVSRNDNAWPSVFIAFLCVVGVPVWSYTLGSCATLLAQWRQNRRHILHTFERQRKAEGAFHRRLQHLQASEATSLCCTSGGCGTPGDARAVDRAEFMTLWLLRNDMVSEAALASMESEFEFLRADQSSKLRSDKVELWKMSLRLRHKQLVALGLADGGSWGEMERMAIQANRSATKC